MSVKRFVKDRNEALFSFDREKIMKYFRKYNIPYPSDDRIFWRAVAKAVCNITNAPPEAVERARGILREYGFSEKIIGD